MGIVITGKGDGVRRTPDPYNGLTWFDTDEARNKRRNAQSQYKQLYNDFFTRFKGGDKDNIYQDYLYLNPEYDPVDIAQKHNVGVDFMQYHQNLMSNPKSRGVMETVWKYDSRDPSLIPSTFNLDAWYSDLKNKGNSARQYVESIYNTKRAQRQIKRANNFARRRGAGKHYIEFRDIDDNIVYNGANSSMLFDDKITIGIHGDFPLEETVAHELAHGRELYNTRTSNRSSDSPYYGNNYSYIRKKHKRWLTPENPSNNHDLELSESYSDLMGLRMGLKTNNIVDNATRRYKNKDIKDYLKTYDGKNNRYLKYHSNINQTRKALNRIYKDGGSMQTVYQPFISNWKSNPETEGSVYIPLPISEYRGADPDREVILIQHTPVVKETDPKVTSKTDNGSVVEWSRSVLKQNPSSVTSESKISDNKTAWNDVWEQYGFKDLLKDDAAYLYILGQIEHESSNFKHMEETASGQAYEWRTDLGNVQKGDGRKYKGRGPVQVTGRDNYRKIYEEFFIPNGLGEYNIVENPELGNDPRIGSLMSIGWFLVTSNGKKAIAAANNHDIKSLTEAINGGLNGFSNRENITKRLMKEAGLA